CVPLLLRWCGRSPPGTRRGRLPVVQRDRDVQNRSRGARRGRVLPLGPAARRDRCALPGAGAAAGQDQPPRLRAVRRGWCGGGPRGPDRPCGGGNLGNYRCGVRFAARGGCWLACVLSPKGVVGASPLASSLAVGPPPATRPVAEGKGG